MQPGPRQPSEYAEPLERVVADYKKYDSIVLLSYQPWEGPDGAQGYALLGSVCNPGASEFCLS